MESAARVHRRHEAGAAAHVQDVGGASQTTTATPQTHPQTSDDAAVRLLQLFHHGALILLHRGAQNLQLRGRAHLHHGALILLHCGGQKQQLRGRAHLCGGAQQFYGGGGAGVSAASTVPCAGKGSLCAGDVLPQQSGSGSRQLSAFLSPHPVYPPRRDSRCTGQRRPYPHHEPLVSEQPGGQTHRGEYLLLPGEKYDLI